jgi:SAM-dependent methyltransferase
MFDIFEKKYISKGPGSDPGSMPEGLGPYHSFLSALLEDRRAKNIVDLGCGDFHPFAAFDWGAVSYTGIDVIGRCISANARYSNSSRQFIRADWLAMPNLPEGDLAICKDVLQHWSGADVHRGLVRLSKYPLVLIINSIVFAKRRANEPIRTGGFRPLNLLYEPYLLHASKAATYEVKTNVVPDTKLILLWEPRLNPFIT